MLFDNSILIWGIKHSGAAYQIKDIDPTSSFNDYPIFIGNKKICFTHFITIKTFFFFLKKKIGSKLLAYRRQGNQKEVKKKNQAPFSIEWKDLQQIEKQEKEKEERKYEEFQDSKQSTQTIMTTFNIPNYQSEFKPFEKETTIEGNQFLSELKKKFELIGFQKKHPTWRRLFGHDTEQQREEGKAKKVKWMQAGYLIIKIERKDEEEFKKSKFWIQLR